MCLASLLNIIGVLRRESRVAELHQVSHIPRSRLVYFDIGLHYQDFEVMPRQPEVADVTPVKLKVKKNV